MVSELSLEEVRDGLIKYHTDGMVFRNEQEIIRIHLPIITDKQNIVRKITITVSIFQLLLMIYTAAYYDLLVLSCVFVFTNLIKHLFLYQKLKKYLNSIK